MDPTTQSDTLLTEEIATNTPLTEENAKLSILKRPKTALPIMNMTKSTLSLPKGLWLKGESNVELWKKQMINLAESNNLMRYINGKAKKPPAVDEDDEDADEEALTKWTTWSTNNTQMLSTIINSCQKTPQSYASQLTGTAYEVWEAILHQYQGKGYVLKYNAIFKLIYLKYEDHSSLVNFITAFRKAKDKLETLQWGPRDEWYPMLFIGALNKAFPIWAERQRSQARDETATAPTLDRLIEDITDEARNQK